MAGGKEVDCRTGSVHMEELLIDRCHFYFGQCHELLYANTQSLRHPHHDHSQGFSSVKDVVFY